MAGIRVAIGWPESAKYIRDLQLVASQRPAVSVRFTSRSAQQIKRACDALDRFGRHLGVDGCAVQLGVA